MKFFLHTAHGDLDQFYGGITTGLLFQGICQGNGAGPAIWLAVSIVLITMVCKNGSSATFTSPLSHRLTTLLGLLYIDDCDLFTIDNNGSSPMDTVKCLQTNIDLWQGGLAVTGGSLSPSKSSWCLLAMRPQGTHWSYHSIQSLPASLFVTDPQCLPQPIKRLNPHEGVAVVGVVQALSGNQQPALQALQTKAEVWEKALCQGFLPCSLAWLALHCVIWPAL